MFSSSSSSRFAPVIPQVFWNTCRQQRNRSSSFTAGGFNSTRTKTRLLGGHTAPEAPTSVCLLQTQKGRTAAGACRRAASPEVYQQQTGATVTLKPTSIAFTSPELSCCLNSSRFGAGNAEKRQHLHPKRLKKHLSQPAPAPLQAADVTVGAAGKKGSQTSTPAWRRQP